MTLREMEIRLEALEKAVEQIRSKLNGGTAVGPNPVAWWTPEGGAGRFADDPGFEEMCRLGRDYRKSLDLRRRKKSKTKVASKSNAHS